MPKRPSPHPTEAELEVLHVLWRKGPSTVREVHETLQADRDTSMTTTLKTMQIMTDKGLIVRTDERPHQFTTAKPEEKTQSGLLADLVKRAFDGSVQKLLIRLVEDANLSAEELKEIRRFIDRLHRGQKGGV